MNFWLIVLILVLSSHGHHGWAVALLVLWVLERV